MSEIDHAFEGTRAGDAEAFSAWVGLVEVSLRGSLRRFARAVDVEAVMQEGLLRMWRLAPALRLEGENASLRFALRLLHNLAVSEARRLRRLVPLEIYPRMVRSWTGSLPILPPTRCCAGSSRIASPGCRGSPAWPSWPGSRKAGVIPTRSWQAA